MSWKSSTSSLCLCAVLVALGLIACTAGGPTDDSTASTPAQSAEEAESVAKDIPGDAPSRESSSESQPSPDTKVPAAPPDSPPPPPEPEIVEVKVPAGAIFELELLSPLDTSVSRVGDEIQARTIAPVFLEGRPVLPRGTYVEGRVTEVLASGRVKGRATIAFTFDRIKTGTGVQTIQTSYVEKEADSSKKKDTAVIGGGAGVGAIVGGIIGGKKGAAIGAVVGGAGGTGVVLATKGEEIKLPVGTELMVRLDSEIVLHLN